MIVYLDFETRSRVDLKKCGEWVYGEHPSTSLLCLAYAIDDGPVHLWAPGDPFPKVLRAAILAGHEFCAHNASFEMAIWSKHCVPKLGWPGIHQDRWSCTAARCAALALPRSLDKASGALGLSVRKDDEGHRIMLRLSKPKKPSKKDPSEWVDDPAKFARLYEYCKQDVEVERLIHRATRPLSKAQQIEWQLDQTINRRGVPVDTETIQAAVDIRQQYSQWIDAEIVRRTDGQVTTGRKVAKLLAWLTSQGLNVENLRAGTVKGALRDESLSPNVKAVLALRQASALSSVAKYNAMAARSSWDHRIRGAHLYHGAATGRWAGKGVQFQNVPRGSMRPAEIEQAIQAIRLGDFEFFQMVFPAVNRTLSSCLRSMVKASPGHRLIVCDFAGIEARVLAWLAKEETLLRAFRKGEDAYKLLATKIYEVDLIDVTKDMRFLGKVATLGLGYQMGVDKFKATVEGYGGSIKEEEAEKIVKVYRKSYPFIVSLWYELQHRALKVTKRKDTSSYKNIHLRWESDFLKIKLPSGRDLSYYKPEILEEESPYGGIRTQLSYMGTNSYTNQWERLRSYGGKLTENVVQAVARDLLVCAMVRLERAGYKIVFHVHDEIVCECPYDEGSIEEMERLMCILPKWAKGCPVAAEGFEAERYRK